LLELLSKELSGLLSRPVCEEGVQANGVEGGRRLGMLRMCGTKGETEGVEGWRGGAECTVMIFIGHYCHDANGKCEISEASISHGRHENCVGNCDRETARNVCVYCRIILK
jgi:hypothetical protein